MKGRLARFFLCACFCAHPHHTPQGHTMTYLTDAQRETLAEALREGGYWQQDVARIVRTVAPAVEAIVVAARIADRLDWTGHNLTGPPHGTSMSEHPAETCPSCSGAWEAPPEAGCKRPWHHASEWADIFEGAPIPPAESKWGYDDCGHHPEMALGNECRHPDCLPRVIPPAAPTHTTPHKDTL